MRKITKWNKALDVNGNGIAKVFYDDNTTEIMKGGKFQQLENKRGISSYNKFYKSMSGLRNSK